MEPGLTAGQRSHLQALVGLLDKEGLLELLAMVEGRLEEIEEEPAPIQETSSSGPAGKAKGGAGWIELKMIKGHGPYAYKRWRVGKTLKSQYLGKVKQES